VKPNFVRQRLTAFFRGVAAALSLVPTVVALPRRMTEVAGSMMGVFAAAAEIAVTA
jgi:hypothetical protein